MGTALIDLRNLQFVLKTLTAKEQLYLEARLNGSTPVAAARVAGYANPDEKASQLERDDRIATAMTYSLKVQRNQHEWTYDDVMSGFQDAYHNAASATEQVMVLREVSKIRGFYAATKHEIDVTQKEQLERLDDDKLAEMAAIDADFVELED